MKRVFSSPHSVFVNFYKSLLEQYDIECITQRENLSLVAGEVPLNECWAELWVVDDDKYEQASGIINEDKEKTENLPEWKCAQCGETIEGQFTDCWKCGTGVDSEE